VCRTGKTDIGEVGMCNRHWCLVAIALLGFGCTSERKTEDDSILANKPTPDAIESLVRNVISELLKVDSSAIPMDKPISDPPLKADELDLVEIVMELEERQGVEIPDAAIESSVRITPNQLVAIVRHARHRRKSISKK
jgi:acyl carrier protein